MHVTPSQIYVPWNRQHLALLEDILHRLISLQNFSAVLSGILQIGELSQGRFKHSKECYRFFFSLTERNLSMILS